jgi:TolB-like protein/Flp pilus assembly protein TadD
LNRRRSFGWQAYLADHSFRHRMSDLPLPQPAGSRAVFLSYAHEDAAAARRLAEALRAAGLEVWFDESELRGGDTWDAKIKRQIRDCALFVPLVSQHTQRRREGYFRLEWHLAEERSRLIARGTPFLVPVAADDVGEREALVPEVFLSLQWTRIGTADSLSAFCERVRTLLGDSGAIPAGNRRSGAGQARPTASDQARRRPWLLPSALLATAVVAVALWQPWRKVPAPRPPAAQPSLDLSAGGLAKADKSIAVLPFANLSPDKENEFFADGVHADLLANLLNLRELRVISGQSVSGYRGTTKRIPEIARELGVGYVLTGSVRRAADTFRVSAQLIDARTDSPIWSPQPYTRKLTDIFALQSELAQSIASELKATLSPEEKKLLRRRPTENLAAYDLYLKALDADVGQAGVAMFRAGLDKRETLLQAAVELDEKFVAAWALLANTHILFVASKYDTTPDRSAKAKAAVDRAVSLEPESPEAIRALEHYSGRIAGDYQRADELLQKLLRVSPNDAEAHVALGYRQSFEGRWPEALVTVRKAAQLDPRNVNVATDLASLLWRIRRFDEAAGSMGRAVELNPAAVQQQIALTRFAFQASGSTREMEELTAKLEAKDPLSVEAWRLRIMRAIWRRDFAEAIRLDRQRPVAADAQPGNAPGFVNGDGTGDMALVYLAQGDGEAARRRIGNFPALLRAGLEREPENSRLIRYLAGLEAILGHKESALRLAQQSVDLAMTRAQFSVLTNAREVLAQVYAIVGEKDRAITELTELLRIPSQVNIHELKVMPVYFNLRGDPRFERLVNDPKNNAPLF